MSNFELWVKGCETNNTNIYPIEGSEKTALYKCWNEYLCEHREYNTTPVYIGWVNGVKVCATTNYQSALTCWKRNSHGTA